MQTNLGRQCLWKFLLYEYTDTENFLPGQISMLFLQKFSFGGPYRSFSSKVG